MLGVRHPPLMIPFCKSLLDSPPVDFAGETAPNNCRAENHPRVRRSNRPYPCSLPGAADKPGIWGPGRSHSGLSVPGGKGQEEGGAGGATKASRPLPCRESHPSKKVALPARENRPQAESVGS